MKYLISILFLGVFATQAQMQRHPGLIRAQATYSVGYLTNVQQSAYYLHGNLEAYLDERISVSGEGYYYLPGNQVFAQVDYHHSIFAGFSRHFGQKGHDFWMGIQPGVSVTRFLGSPEMHTNVQRINPLASVLMGYNFYFSNWFHFFVQSRYIYGQDASAYRYNLSEFRFSAGLGFHLQTMKKRYENAEPPVK